LVVLQLVSAHKQPEQDRAGRKSGPTFKREVSLDVGHACSQLRNPRLHLRHGGLLEAHVLLQLGLLTVGGGKAHLHSTKRGVQDAAAQRPGGLVGG
jgi:hypothetical protein